MTCFDRQHLLERQLAGLGRWALAVAVLAALVAALLAPASSHAQQSLSGEEVERFKQRVSEGKRLFEMDKYRAALEQFEAARAIYDHPRLTFNIAQAHKALDECGASRAAFERYIDNPSAEPKMQQAARELLDELDQSCVETGRLRITCTPDAAHITIVALDAGADGPRERHGTCPIDTEIDVGRYRIEVGAEGYDSRTRELTIALNTAQVVDVSLTRQDSAVLAGLDTHSLIAYSAAGLGATLLVGGLVSDYSSVTRMEELSAAQRDGDAQRIAELRDEADSASTRTAVLYGAGAAMVAGGVIWKLTHADTGAEHAAGEADPKVSVELAPTGVSGRLEW